MGLPQVTGVAGTVRAGRRELSSHFRSRCCTNDRLGLEASAEGALPPFTRLTLRRPRRLAHAQLGQAACARRARGTQSVCEGREDLCTYGRAPAPPAVPGSPAPRGAGTRLLLRVMLSSSLCMFSRSAVSAFWVFKASSHLASLCSSCTPQERERGEERSQDVAPLTGPPLRPGPALAGGRVQATLPSSRLFISPQTGQQSCLQQRRPGSKPTQH